MVVDSSALVAIIQNEPEALAFARAIADCPRAYLSTATYVEASIVMLDKKDGVARIDRLVQAAGLQLEPLNVEQATIARDAYARFGKGRHKARLNLGDTFGYALAMHLGEPLLYKGDDFAQTDVRSALAA